MYQLRLTPRRSAQATLAFVLTWRIAVFLAGLIGWRGLVDTINPLGWYTLYFIGLAWTVWGLEQAAQRHEYERRRLRARVHGAAIAVPRTWNPLDPAAWYYGRRNQRLAQSMTALGAYTFLFLLFYLLCSWSWGGPEPYELPAGGGQETIRQTVQIKKVIQKKYVINPFSSILFNPPPIEQIDPKIIEVTQNLYAVGQGEGEGAGFSTGKSKGKIRFFRLKHSDRNWDRNSGIGGDMNMLGEYGARTRQTIAEQTEFLDIPQLSSFPRLNTPPLVMAAGTTTFLVSASDKKHLRQYLLERHGMILGDNLGGRQFHDQFVAAMREITGAHEVPIPRDDLIHCRPYMLPMLPIVVAHGGTVPLGWKIDGRWVVYYHPGALSDAWRDDHAGIKKEIYEACYQLGVNIIFYANAEFNKWRLSQQP